jgi:hypothetical protein
LRVGEEKGRGKREENAGEECGGKGKAKASRREREEGRKARRVKDRWVRRKK